jgi:Flp pilus assembly protein CpaB
MAPDLVDGWIAPLTFYPDPLPSQILAATTCPMELAKARQWLQRNPGRMTADRTESSPRQNWGPSVPVLVASPDLAKRLNQEMMRMMDLWQRVPESAASGRHARTSAEAIKAGKQVERSWIAFPPTAGARVEVTWVVQEAGHDSSSP